MDEWTSTSRSRAAEGADAAAGPRLRRRDRARQGGCTRRPALAHQLLGLDSARGGKEHYQKHCGTPPEHLLFGLRKSLDMIIEEGLPAVFERHRLLAEGPSGGRFDVLGDRPALRAQHRRACRARQTRSRTLRFTDGHDPEPLRAYCDRRLGVVLGVGNRRPQRPRPAHRPHGPRQRTDDSRHPVRSRDRPDRPQPAARQRWRASRDRLARRVGRGLGRRCGPLTRAALVEGPRCCNPLPVG